MDENPEKRMQYDNTGEVSSGGIETILNSGAIGSCIVITAFDTLINVGAIAHVMLPGSSPVKNGLYTNRYAANAIDLEIIRADGTNAFCTSWGYAEKDENGKVVRLFGSLQDITERKNAEEQLKKIEWLLQNEKGKTEIGIPDYGDLTTINQDRTILD